MMELLGLGGIGSVLTLAIWALLAERRSGKQTARADVLDEQNKELRDKLAERAAALLREKERGDALDAAIVAAVAAGPVDGSFDRLLQARQTAHAASGHAVVPDAGHPGEQASAVGADDLLKPGS